jgi:hypothetical protein
MKKCNALQAVIYGIRPISAGQNVQYEPCEREKEFINVANVENFSVICILYQWGLQKNCSG